MSMPPSFSRMAGPSWALNNHRGLACETGRAQDLGLLQVRSWGSMELQVSLHVFLGLGDSRTLPGIG